MAPVLVFGGSGGVGFALSRLLVEQGSAVHLAARDGARLARCAGQLGGLPYSSCDVLAPEQITDTVRAAASDGALSGLAYCVGSIVLKPLKRAAPEDFVEAFRLNALGAALAIQAAEPALRSGKGSVVLFSTVAAGAGFPNHAVIAAAKGSVEALTRSLAADLAPDVRVNCVAPSLTRTPLAEPLIANDALMRSIAALHPLLRLGEPEDLAHAAAFLLSPQSDWMTGQIVHVDGGRSTVRSKG